MSETSSCEQPIVAAAEPAPVDHAAGRRRFHLYMLCASVATLALSFLLDVRGDADVALAGMTLPPTCQLRKWTGAPCPSCGLTRSFISIAAGDWSRAWRFNPAGILVFAMVAAQIPLRGAQLMRLASGRAEIDSRWFTYAVWMVVGALLLQWAARGIEPWWG